MPSEMRGVPSAFDYTALSAFSSCKYRYYLRHVRDLTPKEPMIAAEFGRVIHMCMDEMYRSWDVDKCIDILKANWKDYPQDSKRTVAVGEKILRLYHEKYKDPPFTVLKSEVAYDIPLKDGIQLIGRIDKIIDWRGRIGVMDHKTTSQLGATYFNKIKPNAQFTGYAYAARELGYKVDFILLDAILTAKGLLVPAQLAKLTPLARDETPVTLDDIKDYEETLEDVIDDIHKCYDHATWPKTGMVNEACCDYVECPYRRICKEDANIREAIIESDYIIEHWDPRKDTNVTLE